MSSQTKFIQEDLCLDISDSNPSEVLIKESSSTRNFNPLQIIHTSEVNATDFYNDWMSFSSKFVNGIYNKI